MVTFSDLLTANSKLHINVIYFTQVNPPDAIFKVSYVFLELKIYIKNLSHKGQSKYFKYKQTQKLDSFDCKILMQNSAI